MATTQSTTDAADFGEKDTRKDDMREATEEFVEDLIDEASSASESETLKEFLDAQSAFHDYSYRNVLLIKMQCPYATRVAGYRTWQDGFDRQVQSGEEAIHICTHVLPSIRVRSAGTHRITTTVSGASTTTPSPKNGRAGS